MSGASYARYSTDHQNETSIDDQVALNERCATRHGDVISNDLKFDDAARSGGTIHHRTGFARMMEAAKRKSFSSLYVENISRLSRDPADVQEVLRQFKFLGIQIIESATGERLDIINATVKGLAAHLMRIQSAQSVHRGLHGIVTSGRSAGGRAYGYRSIPRPPRSAADPDRGGIVEINAAEAEVVRDIFARYAAGETPRAIAEHLNKKGVAAPRGKRWQASCINGTRKRGSGILNNELYRGIRVWNKNEMLSDPNTGNRISKPRPVSEQVRSSVPHLRIVEDQLWDAVALRKDGNADKPPHRSRAAKRVFSGLLKCGSCGSGMGSKGTDKTGRTRIECSRAKESGDCPDPRTYYVDEVEERVLRLLKQELHCPDMIRVFFDAYESEMKALRQSRSSERDALQRDLDRTTGRIDRIHTFLLDGIGDAKRLDADLKPLVELEDDLKRRLALANVPSTVAIHPASRERYFDAIARLHECIGADGQSEAARVVREVVERIVLHPCGPSSNRHTMPPKIEIVGWIESLTGHRFLLPTALRGNGGSGGGT